MPRKSKKRTRRKRGGRKYLGINQKGFQYIEHLKDFNLTKGTDGKHSFENYNICAKKFTEAMNDTANIQKFTEAIKDPNNKMYLEANEFFKMKKYWKVMDGNKLEDYQRERPIGWTMKPLENLRHLLSQSGGGLFSRKKKSPSTTTNTNKLTPEQEEKIFLQVEYDSLFLPPEKNPIFQLQFSDGQYKYLRAKFSHGLWRKKEASFDTLNPDDLLIKKYGIWRYDGESDEDGRIGPAQPCKPKNLMSIGKNLGKGALNIGKGLGSGLFGRKGIKGGQKLVTDCQWGYRCRKDKNDNNNKCLPMIKPDSGSGFDEKILWNPEMPHTSMLALQNIKRQRLEPFDNSSQWDDTGGGKKRRKSRRKRRKSRKKRKKSRKKRKRSRRRRRR